MSHKYKNISLLSMLIKAHQPICYLYWFRLELPWNLLKNMHKLEMKNYDKSKLIFIKTFERIHSRFLWTINTLSRYCAKQFLFNRRKASYQIFLQENTYICKMLFEIDMYHILKSLWKHGLNATDFVLAIIDRI